MLKITVFFSCLICLCQAISENGPASAFQAPAAGGKLSKTSRVAASKMQAEDLEALAVALNPKVGFWDPLNLANADFWDQGNEATVGFLRHAEIKHGRVAMAAFVGYCLQSNGVVFPWKLTNDIAFSDIAAAGTPPEQWDALPTNAKVQILLFIGFLEFWSEYRPTLEADGGAHYMRGGVPGKFPTFDNLWHPVPLNLYDPFGLNAKQTRERLDKGLLAEINNGRLAQIGIFGLLSAQKGLIVPGLDGLNIPKYDGEIMAAFSAGDTDWPFVSEMIKANPLAPFQ
jgi:hypothetical protein